MEFSLRKAIYRRTGETGTGLSEQILYCGSGSAWRGALEHVNQQGLLPLLRKVKARFPEKNIWCYTGYDFEKDILGRMAEQWAEPFIVDKLGDCFSRYDADDLLSALAATRELFLTLAKECASAYGYTTGIPEIDS